MTTHSSTAAYFGKQLSTMVATKSSKVAGSKGYVATGFTNALSKIESGATKSAHVKTGFANGSAVIKSDSNDAVTYSQPVKSVSSSKKT
jgi:hypothetical protein